MSRGYVGPLGETLRQSGSYLGGSDVRDWGSNDKRKESVVGFREERG